MTIGIRSSANPAPFGELALLRRIAKAMNPRVAVQGGGLRLGMGDDAALFQARSGHQTILTCDWFLEGVHFLRDRHPPQSVGWKCLARAVSDVAAMGGVPRCFLLSLALPQTHTGRWLDEFLKGLRRATRRLQCQLAGGDTTRQHEILMSVTVVGEVRSRQAVTRSGARPGDIIFVSGRLGEAEAGLRLLRKRKRSAGIANDPLLKKHLYPEPRLALGQWLAQRRLPTAMIDLSDGLSSDLPRLCAASGVGACIDSAKLPKASVRDLGLGPRPNPLHLALHGGDDYELLFTVRPSRARSLPRSVGGVRLTPIGVITSEKEIILVKENGREHGLESGGWDPFRFR